MPRIPKAPPPDGTSTATIGFEEHRTKLLSGQGDCAGAKPTPRRHYGWKLAALEASKKLLPHQAFTCEP